MNGGNEKILSKALGQALVEDGISMLGLPVSTFKWAKSKLLPQKLKQVYYFSPNEAMIWSLYNPQNHNYLQIKHGTNYHYLPVCIEFDNSKIDITLKNIKTNFSENTFKLDEEFESASAHFFQNYRFMLRLYLKKYFDGELARLKSISKNNRGITLYLQPVRYNTVCKTHMCLDAPISSQSDTLRYRAHRANGLEDLAKSRLANALGVNTLLFTADGELIIQKRSKSVVISHSQLAPPSSGDFEADDFRPNPSDFESVPIFRESKEEVHIHREDLQIDSVKFLGITRELARGGKPEMFFMAYTKLSSKQIKTLRRSARDKWESSKLIFWPFGSEVLQKNIDSDQQFVIRKSMDELLNKYRQSMSIPLLTALAFWQKRLNIQA
jgi:hypothetical protein